MHLTTSLLLHLQNLPIGHLLPITVSFLETSAPRVPGKDIRSSTVPCCLDGGRPMVWRQELTPAQRWHWRQKSTPMQRKVPPTSYTHRPKTLKRARTARTPESQQLDLHLDRLDFGFFLVSNPYMLVSESSILVSESYMLVTESYLLVGFWIVFFWVSEAGDEPALLILFQQLVAAHGRHEKCTLTGGRCAACPLKIHGASTTVSSLWSWDILDLWKIPKVSTPAEDLYFFTVVTSMTYGLYTFTRSHNQG